jgi:hypothetical protein
MGKTLPRRSPEPIDHLYAASAALALVAAADYLLTFRPTPVRTSGR